MDCRDMIAENTALARFGVPLATDIDCEVFAQQLELQLLNRELTRLSPAWRTRR